MQVTVVFGLRQGGGGKVAVAGWVGTSSSSSDVVYHFFTFLTFSILVPQVEAP